jgi:uncharacterized protein YutE (UPF0331/DUF86 family)
MVDRELLLRKLAELELYLKQVSEFRMLTVEQYRTDWKAQRIVERTLQMAFETCADIANHVIADRRLEVPNTYAEAFETLGRAGLLEQGLVEVMTRMAGFRNVLVHEYTAVDGRIVVRILHEHLGDFERFRDAARSWI